MARMLVAVVALVMFGLPAAALPLASSVGTEPTVAVIDVYLKGVEARATGDYAKNIASSLSGSGYAVMEREEVASRFRSVLITPVKRLQEERLADIERLVREGDQLVYTDPTQAVSVLSQARSQLEAIAEGLSANERLRGEFLKTQMLLARSHLDSGNEPKASDVLREVIRTYGDDLDVTERDYHPRLVKLFQKVKTGMRGDRTGVMAVQTPEPGCAVMLDGRALEGETPREFRNLYPGVHYLQVRCGGMESMIRRVNITKDRTSMLVDVAFETVLTVEGGRLGLTFENAKVAQASMVPFAAKFGELVGADLVVVQGFLEDGVRGELKGLMVDVRKGTQVKAASVAAKSNVVTPSSVRALVDVLTGKVPEQAAATALPADWNGKGGGKKWYENYYGWAVTAVGLGMLAWGGYESAMYFQHRDEATKAYPERKAGQSDEAYKDMIVAEWKKKVDEADKADKASKYSSVGYTIGGAAVVTGVVLFVMTDRIFKQKAPRAMVVPMVGKDGGGAMLSFGF